ncbi:nuclear transport factor 2 family protein [Flavobacterium sp. RHBU_24]|uniref:nuclear transport factor 2 family protein n=1 Tax=Flavobacterium sp. RHBU_24 TaxID=3391185 RepID=UPI0039852BA3
MKQAGKKSIRTVVLSIMLLPLFYSSVVTAQEYKESELYQKIIKMDSLLFDQGFNNCNYAVLQEILAGDLEFYHDKGGVQNKKEFIAATQKNICNSPYGKITRKAVAESIEVCPMEKDGVMYGALETGTHEFYIQEPGKPVTKTGSAKFTCLWILEGNSNWKLKRVFSYNHQPAQ